MWPEENYVRAGQWYKQHEILISSDPWSYEKERLFAYMSLLIMYLTFLWQIKASKDLAFIHPRPLRNCLYSNPTTK